MIPGVRRFLKRNVKKSERAASVYASIYPESVRYALQYKAAQMGKFEVISLLDRYVHEVV